MRQLVGTVQSRHNVSGKHLATVEGLILARSGMRAMASGTLNVLLDEQYVVGPDFVIASQEYFTKETLKFQRCRVNGCRMWIMRPDSHERSGHANVLELVAEFRLRDRWNLTDGDKLSVEVEGDDAWWQRPDVDTARPNIDSLNEQGHR